MTMEEIQQVGDDFNADCSDGEKYGPKTLEKNLWEPDPKDIKNLYEQLAQGMTLPLEWKCLGRRSPTPERKTDDMDTSSLKEEESKAEEKSEPTEFDFDEFGSAEAKPITPRRTPGSTKTPKSTVKRVARLDKIMDDMMRHKRINEESTTKTYSKPRTPTSSAGSPGTTPSRPALSKASFSPRKLSNS